MKEDPEKPILLTHGRDAWNNACIQPYDDGWSVYARGYRAAADLLVSHIGERHRDQDKLVYPILFLYRQYIELRLKHLCRDASGLLDQDYNFPMTHRLLDLWSPLKQKVIAIEKSFGAMGDREVLNKAERILRALGDIDPQSDAFRYPVNTKGEKSLDHTVRYINVRHFKEQIDEVAALLEGIDVHLDVLADMRSNYGREL